VLKVQLWVSERYDIPHPTVSPLFSKVILWPMDNWNWEP